MPSELDNLVMAERLNKPASRAPEALVACGQRWLDDRAHCYKCHHFQTNQHMTGRCQLGVKPGTIASNDFMPGDGCRAQYAPKWTPEDGLTLPPE